MWYLLSVACVGRCGEPANRAKTATAWRLVGMNLVIESSFECAHLYWKSHATKWHSVNRMDRWSKFLERTTLEKRQQQQGKPVVALLLRNKDNDWFVPFVPEGNLMANDKRQTTLLLSCQSCKKKNNTRPQDDARKGTIENVVKRHK